MLTDGARCQAKCLPDIRGYARPCWPNTDALETSSVLRLIGQHFRGESILKKLQLVAVLLLAGCQTGPVPAAFKPGTNASQRQADYDQCKIASLREIPQAMATQVSGGVYTPGSVQCRTIGTITSCSESGGLNIPATATTYDANHGLRDRFINRCMGPISTQALLDPSTGTSLSLSICASLRTRWRSSMNAAWIEIAVPGSPSARQAEQTMRPDSAASGVLPFTPNRFS